MQPRADRDGYLGEVRRNSDLIADAANGRLTAGVPSCPEWSMTDLVDHVGAFLGFWAGVLSGETPEPGGAERPRRADGADPIEWYRSIEAGALDALAGVDDLEAERWNWSGRDQTARWIVRRMAAETAIHAWDATGAAGEPAAVPVAAAIDGVDEFLEVFASALASRLEGPPATIHLHVTDAADLAGRENAGEWLVRVAPGSVSYERGHAKGDVAVRGTASDLFLLCWGRIDPAELEIFGDVEILNGVLDALRI